MERLLSYQARRELLQQMARQYQEASPSQKRTLLDAFVATTGYVRTYVMWLPNHAKEGNSHLSAPALAETRAGMLLKQQIPIRTFQEWNETQPGLTSSGTGAPHCGPNIEGSYLYTLTLTDVATGWTECFPRLVSESGNGAGCHPSRERSSLFRFSGLIPITVERRINEALIARLL